MDATGYVVRVVIAMVSCLLAACSCGDGPATLVVNVKTDLVAGIELVRVRSTLSQRGRELGEESHVVTRGVAMLREGERVADFGGLGDGTYDVFVRLVGPGDATVLERRVVVGVAGNTVVTVVFTRDCVGVVCPGAGDSADATECLGGRCVDPRCSDETDATVCVGGECTGDAECTPSAACATGVCEGSSCLFFETRGACASDDYCDPDRGCTPLEMTTADAGPGDAGTDAPACDPLTCDDAVACTTDGCAGGLCAHTPDDALCTERPGGTCAAAAGCSYPCATRADCAAGLTCHEGACLAPTAYRMTSLTLVEPHLWAFAGSAPFCSCVDATSTFNESIARDLAGGSVPVYVFLPFDPPAGTNHVDAYSVAYCPGDGSLCAPGPSPPGHLTAVHTVAGGTPCYEAPAATLSGLGTPNAPAPPCVLIDSPTLAISVGGTTLRLTDVHNAARVSGDGLIDGVVAGFLDETAAREAMLSPDVPLCGGRSAYDLLRGGASCQPGDDRDGAGWWFYLNFTGTRTEWGG